MAKCHWDRLRPSQEAEDPVELTREFSNNMVDPIINAHEPSKTYPDNCQMGGY